VPEEAFDVACGDSVEHALHRAPHGGDGSQGQAPQRLFDLAERQLDRI
jgi:hypothetical protein